MLKGKNLLPVGASSFKNQLILSVIYIPIYETFQLLLKQLQQKLSF